MISSLSPSEHAHFKRFSSLWWDENGPYSILHQMTPLRMQYIKTHIGSPFSGLRILDVGCGGGLLSEPLTRLGAHVVAIDAVKENIEVASEHAQQEGLSIDYRVGTLEEYAHMNPSQFDVIIALEIIEHVNSSRDFLENCAALLKGEGKLFLSTFHRTFKSYIFGILMAEYVLRWVPRGTHHWNKFVKPSEVADSLKSKGLKFEDICGITYDVGKSCWKFSKDVQVNYIGVLSKKRGEKIFEEKVGKRSLIC